jgi:predicted metal-dependent phosphotriesterase family hydrolase
LVNDYPPGRAPVAKEAIRRDLTGDESYELVLELQVNAYTMDEVLFVWRRRRLRSALGRGCGYDDKELLPPGGFYRDRPSSPIYGARCPNSGTHGGESISLGIVTATGVIPPEEAGFTLAHEHLLCDLWELFPSYDNVLDDEKLAVQELEPVAQAGVRTIVDCTSIGLGRNPEALRRISRASGIQIVMGSGWYRERVYPAYIARMGPNELADIIVRDLTEGADGTSVRAGFIGEIGTERSHITPAQERVFRAAARAHRRTGATIWTHTTYFGELALRQIELLAEEGVAPSRIVVSHLGDHPDIDRLRGVAESGVFLGIDNIGYVGGGYPPDDIHARNIMSLLEKGFIGQILMSQDICSKGQLVAYGGRGYGYLPREFLPRLRRLGASESDITRMTVTNPSRALAYEVR